MVLHIVTWLMSFAFHAAFAFFMLMPADSSAFQEGIGEDMMVVEQGIVLEGFAKLGEDFVTVKPVEAPPAQVATAPSLPEDAKPVEEWHVITSETGPDQVDVETLPEIKEAEPEEFEEPVEDAAETEEPVQEKVQEQGPQQVATAQQDSVAARQASSGLEKRGGDATAHSAYLGKLRSHLEHSKVNPRTSFVGTVVVRFRVSPTGELASREIVTSSGQKVLDEAAISSVEKAAPFPPIPEILNRDYVEISVPFKFSVR